MSVPEGELNATASLELQLLGLVSTGVEAGRIAEEALEALADFAVRVNAAGERELADEMLARATELVERLGLLADEPSTTEDP